MRDFGDGVDLGGTYSMLKGPYWAAMGHACRGACGGDGGGVALSLFVENRVCLILLRFCFALA